MENKSLFWGINVGVLMACILTLSVAIVTGSTHTLWGEENLSSAQLICGFFIIWIAASLKVIQVDEVGAVFFYGTPMLTMHRGPKLLLAGIFQLEKFQSSVIQNQFPDEPELIQKTDDKTFLEEVVVVLADGTAIKRKKVRPLRVTTRRPSADDVDDILNSQMTVEFTFWVRWVIKDPFALIIGTGGDVDEAVRQMRDTGESRLNIEVTQMTPSELISQFDGLQKRLFAGIRDSVADWGIEVKDVGLATPDLNHEVAIAMRDITIAKANAVRTRTTADAESYRLAQEGAGRAQARAAELAGEGRGYKEGAELMGIAPSEFLAAQVARDTIGEGDLILGTEGIAQAVGLGKKILKPGGDK